MIPRYNRPKIEKIWSDENKFKIWTEIECLIAERLSVLNVIPKTAAREIRKKAKFNVKEIQKIEIIQFIELILFFQKKNIIISK